MILITIAFLLGCLGTFLVDSKVCREFRKLDEATDAGGNKTRGR